MQFGILQEEAGYGHYCDSCNACGNVFWPHGATAIVGEIRAHICEVCLARSPSKVAAECRAYLARQRAEFEKTESAFLNLISELSEVSAEDWQRIATERGKKAWAET